MSGPDPSPVVNALSAALAFELVVAAVGHSLADCVALVLPVGAVGVFVTHPGLAGVIGITIGWLLSFDRYNDNIILNIN